MEMNHKPGVIAMYLPQYHSVTENDNWWGKGFTDWVNVKKAKPLFEGHYQPRVTLNHEYYNLLDEEAMRNQANLAKDYGVNGFCFYHYWFEGYKILEKPVENYRDMQHIEFPYCLCWANHSWSRTWGDPSEFEEVLLKQRYGNEKDWEEHFEYLLTFFRDNKYICISNKPVLLIYRAHEIPRVESMLKVWNELAVKNGFDGLYLIQMHTGQGYDQRTRLYSAIMDFEPIRTWRSETFNDHSVKLPAHLMKSLKVKNYDLIYEDILSRDNSNYRMRHFYGAFPDWDNTPRKGSWGSVIVGSSPAKFEEYLSDIIKNSKEQKNEFVFINAWNEWAEGAYLEPDDREGYAYLEAIKNAVSGHENLEADPEIKGEYPKADKPMADKPEANSTECNKPCAISYGKYNHMIIQWLNKELRGNKISDFFEQSDWNTIAIYGAGKLGKSLYNALEKSRIRVAFFIDKNASDIVLGYNQKIISLDGIVEQESVDAILVTVPDSFYEIYDTIKNYNTEAEIISLEAIINSL